MLLSFVSALYIKYVSLAKEISLSETSLVRGEVLSLIKWT